MTLPSDIRPAQIGDETAVRTCAQDAYEQYVAAIGQKPAPMVADFASLIASGFVYVAQAPKAGILGFVVFFREEDSVLLENIAVRPEATGQGVAKRLIAFCEAEAKRAGAQNIKLYTNEKMTANLSIYPHLGFKASRL